VYDFCSHGSYFILSIISTVLHSNGQIVKGCISKYRGADKSLARPGRKHATATEDFEFHISYL